MTTAYSSPADLALHAIELCRDLTSTMLEAAGEGDWQRVDRLDGERRNLLGAVDIAALDGSAPDALLEPLRALVAMDGRLVALAAAARAHALTELRQVRGRVSASANYREQSRLG